MMRFSAWTCTSGLLVVQLGNSGTWVIPPVIVVPTAVISLGRRGRHRQATSIDRLRIVVGDECWACISGSVGNEEGAESIVRDGSGGICGIG
eukprot:CAMPEP_0171310798 /NCGR_PEP_ID=MMETSP0816-20121228/21001_1 /TAXON_ID=420281 /ORGANISM="Proboscia inermis, Strain CCAP1064/1" /LENGTH=91 /DNA_ID=CAMNT_0011795149 /DNA_START=246 /DNA_END=521 /DNA_ORIENTATION=+